MTEKQAKDLSMLLEKRGYIVITSYQLYSIGHIISLFQGGPTGDLVKQPMRIIAITDQADYHEQLRLVGAYRHGYTYFYRCITD